MKNKTKSYLLLLWSIYSVLCVSCKGISQEYDVTTQTLLDDMASRETITRFPSPSFTAAQFSSYEPTSETLGNDAWFANDDRSYFLREETNQGRHEYVMMDKEGPGAVVRFWMTFAGDQVETCGKGILRIYIDGEKQPVYEGVAIDMTRGEWIAAPLVSSVSSETVFENRGHNIYFPIAYSRSIKITYQTDAIKSPGAKHGGECVYYNIGYRSYPKDTKVKSFTENDLKTYSTTIARVQSMLTTMNYPVADFSKADRITIGETFKLDASSKAIKALRFTLDTNCVKHITPQQVGDLLRKIVLRLEFDGEQTLYMPVGEFFGSGYQLRKVKTWYTNVDPEGVLSAYWLMPFQRQCNISLLNPTGYSTPIPVSLEIVSDSYQWDDERSMYFGGSWYQLTQVPTRLPNTYSSTPSYYDMNFVTIKGQGVYVGDAVTLFNTANAWWGEGDEKVFIDGEKFPSFFGTGTEDYYGYAWCRPESFTGHPFIAQPDGSGNFVPGYTSNIRFRSLDAIPFKNALKFDMEMWHWASTTINFAPSTFFYVRPGAISSAIEDSTGMQAPLAYHRSDVIPPVVNEGKIEGEDMEVLSCQGTIAMQTGIVHNWSNRSQLWWTDQQISDTLQLSFVMPQMKTGKLIAYCTVAFDYGSFDIFINGKKVEESNVLYSKELTVRAFDWGIFTLPAGKNTIRIVCKGFSNEVPKGLFGLDYLTIQ